MGGPESAGMSIHCSEMDESAQREALLHLSNVIDLQSTESVGFVAQFQWLLCHLDMWAQAYQLHPCSRLGWVRWRGGQFLVTPRTVPQNYPEWPPRHNYLNWIVFHVSKNLLDFSDTSTVRGLLNHPIPPATRSCL